MIKSANKQWEKKSEVAHWYRTSAIIYVYDVKFLHQQEHIYSLRPSDTYMHQQLGHHWFR